jgi:hypothetical protein
MLTTKQKHETGTENARTNNGIFFQPKLSINQPDDVYEQEADTVADKVMRMNDSAFPQQSFFRPPVNVQRKCAQCEEEEKAQRKESNSGQPTAINEQTENYISNLSGGASLSTEQKSFFESGIGYDFSDVKIHTNSEARQSAKNINALAYTHGSNIVFGEGQYQPDTDAGKKLLAHELTHVVQQKGNAMVQRQEVIEMPATTIHSGMPSDLSSLSTPPPPGSMTMAVDTAHIELNSQLPTTVLPFTTGGWNGNDIANKLGQYDRIPGTDSDAVRCVQAVALMSHILMGPAAAIGYLSSISLQGMLSTGGMTARVRTALRVIDYVKRQIETRHATYGDMYWAMEAVHDLFYADDKGTPATNAGTVREQITPMLDTAQTMTNMDVWCATGAELLSQAASLQPGEQFMLNSWNVSFNSVFDEAGVPTTQQRLRYTQTDERDRPLRTVSIRRIDTTTGKPNASAIDLNRDRKHGHQMLIFKDAADSHIKLYEPELTVSGNHLFDLTADTSVIDRMLFFDQPSFELFEYVQLWGKMSPATASPFTSGSL